MVIADLWPDSVVLLALLGPLGAYLWHKIATRPPKPQLPPDPATKLSSIDGYLKRYYVPVIKKMLNGGGSIEIPDLGDLVAANKALQAQDEWETYIHDAEFMDLDEFVAKWRDREKPKRPKAQGKCPTHCWPWVKFDEGQNCPECEKAINPKKSIFDLWKERVERDKEWVNDNLTQSMWAPKILIPEGNSPRNERNRKVVAAETAERNYHEMCALHGFVKSANYPCPDCFPSDPRAWATTLT